MSPDQVYEYRAIAGPDTRLLRRSVLHPNRSNDALLYPGDSAPAALHVGAFCEGMLVGTGSIWPAPLPQSEHHDAWRIVGLAVDESHRGSGIGSEVLGRLLGHAGSHHSKLAWCNSRESAVAYYRRYGFTTTSPYNFIGPNGVRVRMTRRLERTALVRRGATIGDDGIRRIDTYPQLSRVVVFNNVVHIGGLLPNRHDVRVGEQTREVLEKIEMLLIRAGSSKSKLITAMIWLKDIATAAEANAVWEAWVPAGTAPARSCVQAIPGAEEFGVEIAAVAAI